MRQLEAGLLMPEIQMISFRMQRTVLLYTLQLNLVASSYMLGIVRGGSDQVSESISWEKVNSKCLKNFARIYNLKGLFNQLYDGHC